MRLMTFAAGMAVGYVLGTRARLKKSERIVADTGIQGEPEVSASRSSTHDVSSGHRGGKRSHTGAQGRTKQQLYNEAKQRNIKGRSSMSKAELERALAR